MSSFTRSAGTLPVTDSLAPAVGSRSLPRKGEVGRILCLKLDHIGDILIGAPALMLLRRSFPDAHITLICAPWNVGLAKRLGVADTVHVSDFFSQNSLADLDPGAFALRRRQAMAALQALDLAPFDLAIDLRRDDDTRELLKLFDARAYAGFGDLATFGYLDVALPFTRTPDDAAGPARLRLAPDDLNAGTGHLMSEAGLHLTSEQAELQFTLETDALWPPADDGIDDHRLLGTALWRIDVRTPDPAETGGDDQSGPQEIGRQAMSFGPGWLDWEPWGRWSSAARSSCTLRFQTSGGSRVELLVQAQGHTSPSHPVATVTLAAGQGQATQVFRAGDGPRPFAVLAEARTSPPTARSVPFLLRAGRYAGVLRVSVPTVGDYVPLTLSVCGSQIGIVVARLTTPDTIEEAGELRFPFEVELRDTAEPMQVEIAFAGERRSSRMGILGVEMDCLQARSPRLPVTHIEAQLLDLAAITALRFAPALVVAGGEAEEALRRPRDGSTASGAVSLVQAARSPRNWFGRKGAARRVIGIGIGANKATKLWPERYFVDLCRRLLHRSDVAIAFIGGPKEAEDVHKLTRQLGQGGRVLNLVGCCKIEDLGEVLAELDGFIGLDTGTTHFAGRVGVKTLALFGASHDPRMWGPVGERSAWTAMDVPCGSCSKAELIQCGFGLQCMTMLTPDTVWPIVRRTMLD